MTAQTAASVGQLTREAETSREAFVSTVSELKEEVGETIVDLKARLSPAHVKSEIKTYVREESSQLIASIERKARDNPLQAIAIGAGILYPFWGMLRSISMPLLLIGGGVWLSKQKTGTIREAATEGANDIAHSALDLSEAVGARVDGLKETIRDTAQDVMETATTAASSALAAVKAETSDAVETVSAGATDMGAAGIQAVNRSRTAFDEIIERNPLLVGGVAFAIGAFIASSLPGSRAEDRLFGDSSDAVKDKASEVVSRGVEQAKNIASEVAEDISAAAAQEGLGKDGLSRTIEGAASGVKAVLDKGLATALGSGESGNLPH
jgi:ElaB/YqjD/DUF883 family membrane-anchored ribosome-binding protein